MARRLRRRWVVVAVLVALLLGGIRLQDQPTTIYYYRVVDQQTLVVGTTVGPWAWMRVTSVNETPSTVTITVSSLLAPMGGSYGRLELLVKLAAPLGSRGRRRWRQRPAHPAHPLPAAVLRCARVHVSPRPEHEAFVPALRSAAARRCGRNG